MSQKVSAGQKYKSGFRGVTRFSNGKWRAYLYLRGSRSKHLGYFDDPELAARAYDQAAIEHFSEAAITNEHLGLLPPATDDPQSKTAAVPSIKATQRGSGQGLYIVNRHLTTADYEWLLALIESPDAGKLFGSSEAIRAELAAIRNLLYKDYTARQNRTAVHAVLDTNVDKRLSPGECKRLGLTWAALVRRVRAGETSGAPLSFLASLAALYVNSAARRMAAAGVSLSWLDSLNDIRQLYAGPVQARPRERPNPGVATGAKPTSFK